MANTTTVTTTSGITHAAKREGPYIVVACGLNVNSLAPSYVVDDQALEQVNCKKCLQTLGIT